MSNDFTARWNQFASTATIVFTIAATFIITPPLFRLDQDSKIEWFVKFLITSLIALFTIPLLKKSKKKDYKFWLRTAGFDLGIGLIVLCIYVVLLTNWSVPYYFNERLIIGKTMSDEAKRQKLSLAPKLNLPYVDDETFVKARKGQTQYIWPRQELQNRFFILCVLYVLTFAFVTVFIISVIQAIYCYERPD